MTTQKTLAKSFAYLDQLRDSGRTNMYAARPYLIEHFGMGEDTAGEHLTLWMKTFGLDKTPVERATEALEGTP